MRARLTAFSQKNRFSIWLIVLILLGSGVFTFLYVSSEKAFYVWDNDEYQLLTCNLLKQFQVSIQSGIRFLIEANQGDYSVYYGVPLLPLLVITGNSRPAYEISLVIIYLVPFILVTGLIGRKLLAEPPRRVFRVVVGVGFILPVVWLPTLRGYPDTAASLMVALAILLYLKDPGLKRTGQLIILGLLLGLAVLIRRHFAYSALAFFGVALVAALPGFAREARQGLGKASRKLLARVFRLGLVGIFGLLLVALLDFELIRRAIVIDYNRLYSSYLEPWPEVLGWFLGSFGWLPSGGATVGLYLVWRKSSRKEEVLFFGLFGAFEFILWVVYVRQISVQYTLHLSVFFIIGLAGLFLNLWEMSKTRLRPRMAQAAAGLGIVLLSLNCLSGLLLPGATFPAALFSGNWQPLHRDDYQQVISLETYLDEQTTLDDKIYVAASSYLFNYQTFLKVNEVVTGQSQPTITLFTGPTIDSRDFYPLEFLLDATLVVLIDPPQYHISPDQQRVVEVGYDMFKQNLGLAQDFTVLNPDFFIDSQTRAIIYKRIRATPLDTALKSLQIIQSYVRQVPGNQYDWINLDPARPASLQFKEHDGTGLTVDRSQWKANPAFPATQNNLATDSAGTRLVYARPVTGKEVFRGKVTFDGAGCGETLVDFSGSTPEKAPARFAEFKLTPGQNPVFGVDFARAGAGQFVVLEIVPPSNGSTECSVKLELTPE